MSNPDVEAWLAAKEKPASEGPDVEAWLAAKEGSAPPPTPPAEQLTDPVQALLARETAARRLKQGVRSAARTPSAELSEAEKNAEAAAFGGANATTLGMFNRGLGGIDYLRGGSESWGKGIDKVAAHEEELRKNYPVAHLAGSVAGGVGSGIGAAKAGLGFSREGASTLQRFGMGAAEGAGWGAAQGAGQTYSGNLPDYIKNATVGGAFGTVGGALGEGLGIGAGAAYAKGRDYANKIFPEPLIRGARADAQGLRDLPKLGPDAMLPDAGPSMLATAQQAALGIGPNRTSITNTLMERDAGTIGRLRSDIASPDAFGPVPRVSQIREGLDANRQRINAEEYTPRIEGVTLPPRPTNAAMDQLRELEESSRLNLGGIRDRLLARGQGANRAQNPDLDPQAWLAARHHIDDLVETARANGRNYEVTVLGNARRIVDGHLAAHVPGIKQADAIQQANTIAGQELDRGGTILDTGKRAVRPDDLHDIMQANAVPRGEAPPGPPSANLRLKEGARAEIDRRIGTVGKDANALSKLEQTVGGPESYNALKLEQIFGAQQTEAVRNSIARNRKFRETYQDVSRGSQTAQRLAAKETSDAQLPPFRNVAGTIEQVGRMGLGAYREAQKQAQREEIAKILALRDPGDVEAARQLLLAHINSSAPGIASANQRGRSIMQGVGSILGPAYVDQTR